MMLYNLIESRYEKKIVFKDRFDPILIRVLSNFQKEYETRYVNNIYFDSLNLKCYNSHINGELVRLKYRVRWYSKTLGKDLFSKDNHYNAEIKKKINAISEKYTSKFDGLNLNLAFQEHGVFPTLLNFYSRSYFYNHKYKIRLTLDSNLSFKKINYAETINTIGLIEIPDIVLELKYDTNVDHKSIDFIRSLNIQIEKYSKYIAGMELFI